MNADELRLAAQAPELLILKIMEVGGMVRGLAQLSGVLDDNELADLILEELHPVALKIIRHLVKSVSPALPDQMAKDLTKETDILEESLKALKDAKPL